MASLLGLCVDHACLGYAYVAQSSAAEITDRGPFFEVT